MAISAIAGVPTHESAAIIRRLYNQRAINGVATDELAAARHWIAYTAVSSPQ